MPCKTELTSFISLSLLCVIADRQYRTASWMEEKRQDFVTLSLKKPPVCRLSTTPAAERDVEDVMSLQEVSHEKMIQIRNRKTQKKQHRNRVTVEAEEGGVSCSPGID